LDIPKKEKRKKKSRHHSYIAYLKETEKEKEKYNEYYIETYKYSSLVFLMGNHFGY